MATDEKYDPERVSFVKGGRPRFFDDPEIDRLLAMIMALLGEMSVLRDRLDAHERLAADGKSATPEAVDRFEPDAEAESQRARNRQQLTERVLSVLTEEVVRLRHEAQ